MYIFKKKSNLQKHKKDKYSLKTQNIFEEKNKCKENNV